MRQPRAAISLERYVYLEYALCLFTKPNMIALDLLYFPRKLDRPTLASVNHSHFAT